MSGYRSGKVRWRSNERGCRSSGCLKLLLCHEIAGRARASAVVMEGIHMLRNTFASFQACLTTSTNTP